MGCGLLTMKPEDKKTVIARVPAHVLRLLDGAARRSRRSRSAELCLRLQESLASSPDMLVKVSRADDGPDVAGARVSAAAGATHA